MAAASFPAVCFCLPPADGRRSSSFSCLLLPLSYSFNPSSLNSPQPFEFWGNIKHTAYRRSLRCSRVQRLRLKSLVAPREASIGRLTSNVSLYSAIIQGMCLRGNIEAAKRLYKKMREIGLVPVGEVIAKLEDILLLYMKYETTVHMFLV